MNNAEAPGGDLKDAMADWTRIDTNVQLEVAFPDLSGMATVTQRADGVVVYEPTVGIRCSEKVPDRGSRFFHSHRCQKPAKMWEQAYEWSGFRPFCKTHSPARRHVLQVRRDNARRAQYASKQRSWDLQYREQELGRKLMLLARAQTLTPEDLLIKLGLGD